ncbi:MAG: hypothetical protein HRT45_03900 [Bdellovibrionales bacterium]|nr:hypothetical protein [Bdellovibrionales bacterium]
MKQTKTGLMALTFTFMVCLSLSASSDVAEKVRDRLRSADLSVDTDLVDINLTDFARARFNIGVGVRQNRDKKTYSRTERVKLGASIGRSFGENIFFNSFVDGGSELEIIRQFDSQVAALNIASTPPYNPMEKIPVSAEKAQGLAVGDYVKFKSRLAFSVGPRTAHSIGITRISGAVSYLLYGDFQMEVYKMDDDEYLLRASTLKKGTKSLSLSYQPTSELKLFAVVAGGFQGKVLEQIEKTLIPTTFASVSTHESSGNLLTIEYLYNFDSPSDPGAKAFEDVVNPENWVRDSFEMLNPLREQDRLAEAIQVRFEESERLADLATDSEYDVLRNSRSDAKFKENGGRISLDLKLIDGGWNTNFVQQDLTVQDSAGLWKKYRIVNLVKQSQLGFLGLLGVKTRREGNLVFEMNEQGLIDNFMNLSYHYSRDEKTLRRSELDDIQGQIHRMMPEKYHSQLTLDQWESRILRRDTRVDAELIFHEPGWELVSRLGMQEMKDFLADYFQMISDGQEQKPKRYGNLRVRNGSQSTDKSYLENAKSDIEYIERCLPAALSRNSGVLTGYDPKRQFRCSSTEIDFTIPSLGELLGRKQDKKGDPRLVTHEERWQYFVALRKNITFFQLSSGILARLLELAIEKHAQGTSFSDYAAFRLVATTKDEGAIEVTIGDFDQADGMRNILRSRDRILNREFDPEIFKELN